MQSETQLRAGFNQEAKLYDKSRPLYPGELIEQLIDKAKLSGKARLLEIGPGTGQATLPLARRGYNIVAVELGNDLAEVARHNLSTYPDVEVITGTFEETDLPNNSFDLVYAATAIHWIKPEIRFAKPYDLLINNGHLAIIHTNHVSDERGDLFFKATQQIYDKFFPNSKPFQPPRSNEIKPTDLDENYFQLRYFEYFPLIVTYNAAEYIELLATYSPNLALPDNKRHAFFTEIKQLIGEKFGGKVDKHFAMSLTIGMKINRVNCL